MYLMIDNFDSYVYNLYAYFRELGRDILVRRCDQITLADIERLHPQAIVLLASMIKTASRNAQVVVSTQSTRLVDEFSASDVAVIERDASRKSSIIKRLDAKSLEGWLGEYSLSELWEKNVFGGQP